MELVHGGPFHLDDVLELALELGLLAAVLLVPDLLQEPLVEEGADDLQVCEDADATYRVEEVPVGLLLALTVGQVVLDGRVVPKLIRVS